MNDADVLRAARSILHDHGLPDYWKHLAESADMIEKAADGGPVACTAGLFTRDEVGGAVNAGADLVLDDSGIGVSDRGRDQVNLIVNAQMQMLDAAQTGDKPTLDQVIVACYDTDDVDCDGDEPPEPGTPEYDAGVIRTVRGWVS